MDKYLFSCAPDLHFSEVDGAFIEDSGRVEVTATATSHKRRELALEAIVARLSEADGEQAPALRAHGRRALRN